jgi:hypothetical protein
MLMRRALAADYRHRMKSNALPGRSWIGYHAPTDLDLYVGVYAPAREHDSRLLYLMAHRKSDLAIRPGIEIQEGGRHGLVLREAHRHSDSRQKVTAGVWNQRVEAWSIEGDAWDGGQIAGFVGGEILLQFEKVPSASP